VTTRGARCHKQGAGGGKRGSRGACSAAREGLCCPLMRFSEQALGAVAAVAPAAARRVACSAPLLRPLGSRLGVGLGPELSQL
jgi:hypothetical protein